MIYKDPLTYKQAMNDYLTNVNKWLVMQFQIKDYICAMFLGIQIVQNRKNKSLAMIQASYIDKMLYKYKMQNSKKDGLSLSIF